MKTYSLICPDPDCAAEFDVELDPATLTEDGDLIECPECLDEWEWEYDAEADTLILLEDDEDLDVMDLTGSPDESGDEEDGEL
jgi:hypothetical protein